MLYLKITEIDSVNGSKSVTVQCIRNVIISEDTKRLIAISFSFEHSH